MISSLRRLIFRLDGRRSALRRYADGLREIARPPYDLSLYADCVAAATQSGFATPAFAERAEKTDAPNVYFRHDIDLADCPRRLGPMIEIEQRSGVRSGVYFQANDQAPYDLREYRTLANDLAMAGVEVGLHTICYAFDAPWNELRAERQRFFDAVGFAPSSVNAHGLGNFRWQERLAFYREATSARLRAEGFFFSDMSHMLRAYDHVAEDCHLVPRPKSADGFGASRENGPGRFLKDDFLRLPRVRGACLLVLTHPGYWVDSVRRPKRAS